MKIEKLKWKWNENYSAAQIALSLKIEKLFKKCGSRNRFSLYLYYFKKWGREGWGGGGGWLSQRGCIFEKNIPGNG